MKFPLFSRARFVFLRLLNFQTFLRFRSIYRSFSFKSNDYVLPAGNNIIFRFWVCNELMRNSGLIRWLGSFNSFYACCRLHTVFAASMKVVPFPRVKKSSLFTETLGKSWIFPGNGFDLSSFEGVSMGSDLRTLYLIIPCFSISDILSSFTSFFPSIWGRWFLCNQKDWCLERAFGGPWLFLFRN